MNSEFSDDMDFSLLQLERELQSLTPMAPRADFVQSLKTSMEPVPRLVQPARITSFPWRKMVAPAAAAAAAVAVLSVEHNRRTTRPAPAAVNEIASAVVWEPMRMLPKYRALLDEGYVLTGDMEFIPPGFVPYNAPVWSEPANNSVTRASFPRQDRFIMPAGYGTGQMNVSWH